jgi:hypothetical protein
MRRWRRTIALALPLLSLGVAGCGSSSKPAPDPASLIPATAPLYVSAVVRPQGTLKTDAVAAAQAVTHESQPFSGLLGAVNMAPGGTSASVDRSAVESWLGERAGLFVTRLGVPGLASPTAALSLLERALTGELFRSGAGEGGRRTSGALVLDVSDAAKARQFFAGVPGSRSAAYRGVPYSLSAEGEAYGLVGNFMVIGTEAGLREVIDVSQGAPALDHNGSYSELRDSAAPGSTLANAYAQVAPLLHAVRMAPGIGSQLLSLVHALAPSGALYLSLAPESHQVRLDIDASSAGAPAPPSASESEQAAIAQQLFQALPENSWFALRIVDFGAFAERALSLASGASGAGTSAAGEGTELARGLLHSLAGSSGSLLSSLAPALEHLLASLESKRALVDHELLSWMGPAAIFVSGSSLAEFNAGVVISPKSASLARAAVSKLPALLAGSGATVRPVVLPGTEAAAAIQLKGLPVPLQVAAAGDKFVIGVGLSPVAQALSPSGTLGASSAYQSAVKSLGEGIQPALMLNVPALVGLVNVLGSSGNGLLAQLMPYLRSLSTLTGGTKKLGGNSSRARLLFGLP